MNLFRAWSGKTASRVEAQSSHRVRLVSRALAATVLAFTTTVVDATAAEPVGTGPRVTVTATRNPNETPSETKYADVVYKKLQSASRYPTSREASLTRPSGTTTVWVEVARDGKVKGRGIQQSSGSPLLDQEARSLVGRTRFPAFASGDWGDGATHRFVVSYEFDGVAMTAGKTPTASR